MCTGGNSCAAWRVSLQKYASAKGVDRLRLLLQDSKSATVTSDRSIHSVALGDFTMVA